jgi:hypothetical protein
MKKNTQIAPVFLLGAGRSGTKFLRDILGVSSNVSIIPYDVGYVWRYRNEKIPHDEFTLDLLNDSIKQYVRKTLPQLVKKDFDKSNATILIEKSVPNTLRPAFVQAIYPEAKFIHLIRDGRAVTESAMRLWQASPERGYLLKKLQYFPWKNYKYALWYIANMIKGKLSSGRGQQIWGSVYKGLIEDAKTLPLETVCARQWKKCIEISLSQLSEFDKKNVIEVHYEDLMQDAKALESICEFIGINDKNTVVKNYESKVVRTHADKWKISLKPEQLELINNEIAILNTTLGYGCD